LRGLSLFGGFALVGLSLPRRNKDFAELPLDDRLKQNGTALDCAIQVIDLGTGQMMHWMRLGGVVQELYDIAVLPAEHSPMVVGFTQGQINRLISISPMADS
jgi:uncharacterized protein (TIGR03032 family)